MKSTALARARITACRLWPAATSAILSLVPVERRELGTIAVDKHWRIYYDPEYLATVTPETAAVLVLHEVSHLLLRHHARGGNATDWELWNWATDCSVNYRLQVEGHDVPKDWLTPIRFQLPGNLSAEQYYRLLEEQRNAQAQQEQQPESEAQESDEPDEAAGDDPQEGEGDQSGTEAPEQAPAAGSGEPGDGAESGDGDAGPSQDDDSSATADDRGSPGEAGSSPGDQAQAGESDGGCGQPAPTGPVSPGTSGSCADGQLKPWEEPAPEAEGEGPPAIEPHEQEQIIRRVAESMEKGVGKGSGSWSSFVQQILHPKVDPKVLLTQAIRKAAEQTSGGHDDTSYRRPSRRPSIGGVIRPSRVALIPRICIIVDSSGSMSQKDLGYALGLIGKVLSGFRLRDGVQVMIGDTTVQSCEKVFDPKQLNVRGGGGTEMDRLIVAASELTPKPQLIVVATDGYTGWPRQNVGVPVVACLTRENTKRDVPAWIKSIVLA